MVKDPKFNVHLLAVSDVRHVPPTELFDDIKREFFASPWLGSKLYVMGPETTSLYETIDVRVKRISELQEIAAIFREISKASGATESLCALNVEAVPSMPGSIGSIFGFHALIIVRLFGDEYSYDITPYENWSGRPELTESTDSAIKDLWESRLGEPFDDCVKRLFIPLRENDQT